MKFYRPSQAITGQPVKPEHGVTEGLAAEERPRGLDPAASDRGPYLGAPVEEVVGALVGVEAHLELVALVEVAHLVGKQRRDLDDVPRAEDPVTVDLVAEGEVGPARVGIVGRCWGRGVRDMSLKARPVPFTPR